MKELDLRHVSCGLIPAIRRALEEWEGLDADQGVAFLVSSHVVPQIIHALATGDRWSLAVDDLLDHSRVVFTRGQGSRPSLDLI